jgi:hypothetical protein
MGRRLLPNLVAFAVTLAVFAPTLGCRRTNPAFDRAKAQAEQRDAGRSGDVMEPGAGGDALAGSSIGDVAPGDVPGPGQSAPGSDATDATLGGTSTGGPLTVGVDVGARLAELGAEVPSAPPPRDAAVELPSATVDLGRADLGRAELDAPPGIASAVDASEDLPALAPDAEPDAAADPAPDASPEVPIPTFDALPDADPDAPPDIAPDAPLDAAPDTTGPADAPGPDAAGADAVSPPALTCPVDPQLALCLRFEEAVMDESQSRIGFSASSLAFASGPDGRAAVMGTTSRIRSGDTTALDVSQLTIEAWVRPSVFPMTGLRSGVLDYQRQYALFIMPGGGVMCGIGGGRIITIDSLLSIGVWQSLACTTNGSTIDIWVNGTKRGSLPINGVQTPSGTGGVAIGGNVPVAGQDDPDPFVGEIDNVRVWRRVRSSAEICRDAVACP